MTNDIGNNYISSDEKHAINAYGEHFSIGDLVIHQDTSAGSAKILSFSVDKNQNEIIALTDKGTAPIDFIEKLKI